MACCQQAVDSDGHAACPTVLAELAEVRAQLEDANALLADVDGDPTALAELYDRTRAERDALLDLRDKAKAWAGWHLQRWGAVVSNEVYALFDAVYALNASTKGGD